MVSDFDEIELAKQLERLEQENREVSGDEDSEGEIGMGDIDDDETPKDSSTTETDTVAGTED